MGQPPSDRFNVDGSESREGCGNQLPGLEAGPKDTVLVQGSPAGSGSGKKTLPHPISLAQETQGHALQNELAEQHGE